MGGGVSASGGQNGFGGAQSRSDGHSTLKEKRTSASCGSNPASTSVTANGSSFACAASLTSRNAYGEKSPVSSVRMTRVLGASANAVKKAFSCGVPSGGGAEAGAIHWMTMLV